MALLQEWRDVAYSQETDKKQLQKFWSEYFMIEKGIYEQLLSSPEEVVSGTVKELAEKYNISVQTMTGFLDGINDSLKTPNPIEEMTEDTEEKREAIIDMLLIPALQVEEEIETVEETTISVTPTQIETEDSLPLIGRMKLQELIGQVEMTTEEATIEEKVEVETRERSPAQSHMDMTLLWRTRVEKVQLPSGFRVS